MATIEDVPITEDAEELIKPLEVSRREVCPVEVRSVIVARGALTGFFPSVRVAALRRSRSLGERSAMSDNARLYYAKGKGGVLEFVVPHGTRLVDLLKAQEQISKEILPHISPRGCGPCLSGIPLIFREELENVAQVNLKTSEIAQGAR